MYEPLEKTKMEENETVDLVTIEKNNEFLHDLDLDEDEESSEDRKKSKKGFPYKRKGLREAKK